MQQQQAVMIQQRVHVTESATRAQTEEHQRADMARIAARLAARVDGGNMDNKALGQPFKYTGKKGSDFAEWHYKIRIFMGAKLGHEILKVMSWANKQRKSIVRMVQNYGGDSVPAVMSKAGMRMTLNESQNWNASCAICLRISHPFFTSDDANIVRNSGDSQGLEAWRRLHNEYDPT